MKYFIIGLFTGAGSASDSLGIWAAATLAIISTVLIIVGAFKMAEENARI